MNKSIIRILVLGILMSFIFSIALSSVFIAGHSSHDCIGEYCAVCHTVNSAKELMKRLISAAILLLCLFAVLRLIITQAYSLPDVISTLFFNPTKLNIKLNN